MKIINFVVYFELSRVKMASQEKLVVQDQEVLWVILVKEVVPENLELMEQW